jgi:putative FmdB family regulatory protein
MPLYDYRCAACGRLIEVMHGINDAGPEACVECGGTMHKVLSPPAIHFKGSGWAKKDAASQARKASSKGTSGGSESKDADGSKDAGGDKSTKQANADAGAGKTTAGESKPAAAAKSD